MQRLARPNDRSACGAAVERACERPDNVSPLEAKAAGAQPFAAVQAVAQALVRAGETEHPIPLKRVGSREEGGGWNKASLFSPRVRFKRTPDCSQLGEETRGGR
jgi:hypothetical protein